MVIHVYCDVHRLFSLEIGARSCMWHLLKSTRNIYIYIHSKIYLLFFADLVAAQTRISNTDKTLNVAKGDTNIKLHCKVISDEYPLNLFNKVLVWSKIQDKSSTLDTEDFETTAINTGSSAIINDPFKTSLSINISSDTATKATDFTLTMSKYFVLDIINSNKLSWSHDHGHVTPQGAQPLGLLNGVQ